MIDTVDASEALDALKSAKPHLFEGTTQLPKASISTGDGMFVAESPGHYFECGLQGLQLCRQAVALAGSEPGNVETVLDYACGFGRVGRALQVGFPAASIVAADIDPKALSHYSSILGIDATHQLTKDIDAAKSVPGAYDLIWVGSLFTHLPESHVDALLRDLTAMLTEKGVLAFTLHGDLVVGRLDSRERNYGLDEEGINAVVSGYRDVGFGFAAYPNLPGYGISATAPEKLEKMAEAAGIRVIDGRARGWVSHQDFYAVVRAG